MKTSLRVFACAAIPLLMGAGAVQADDALGTGSGSGPGAALRAKFADLTRERSQSQFHRPLYIDSSEEANGVTGEIHALVEQPFAAAGAALDKPARWCEILILHLNVKYCRPSADAQGVFLHVVIGKKYDQSMDAAYPVDFAYQVTADSGTYLQVKLSAAQGPLSTSDYRIMLEAAPAEEEGRTLIRLSYSYSHGMVARLAMQVYLATIGRNKVGFTVVGHEPDGGPTYIGGMRGVTERNTMRYYLAIEAFLGAMSALPDARVEKGFRDWFTAIERYPRQLHEMGQVEYLAMKRMEYARQQMPPKAL